MPVRHYAALALLLASGMRAKLGDDRPRLRPRGGAAGPPPDAKARLEEPLHPTPMRIAEIIGLPTFPRAYSRSDLAQIAALEARVAGRPGMRRLALALSLPLWLVAPACSLDRLPLGARPDPPCVEGTEAVSAATPSGRERGCRRRADGVRHGPYLAWHANGRTQAEGAFADGREHGRWTRWYANGRRLLEGEYRDGVKQGRWTFWYANGVEKEAGEFRDGREQDRWIRWFENGEKLAEGDYRDGVREGRWTFWYESGLTRETGEYRNGERRGAWRRFSVNGRPCDDAAA